MHALCRFEQTTQWNTLCGSVRSARQDISARSIDHRTPMIIALRPAAHDRRSLFTRECPCHDPYAPFSLHVFSRDRSSARRRGLIGFLAAFALHRNLQYFSGDASRPSIDKLGCEDGGTRVFNYSIYSRKKKETIYSINI